MERTCQYAPLTFRTKIARVTEHKHAMCDDQLLIRDVLEVIVEILRQDCVQFVGGGGWICKVVETVRLSYQGCRRWVLSCWRGGPLNPGY